MLSDDPVGPCDFLSGLGLLGAREVTPHAIGALPAGPPGQGAIHRPSISLSTPDPATIIGRR